MNGDNPQVPRLVAEPERLIPITVAASKVLGRGTVMGRVTATGKYIESIKTAVDGSQCPIGILAQEADARGADVDNVGMYLAGVFNGRALIFDASWSIAALKPALSPLNIFIRNG